MNLKPIELNLAGTVYQFAYNARFSRLMFFRGPGLGWVNFTRTAELPIGCGRTLKKSEIVLTIKHKLGLI